jgi:hypothetical protein
MEPATMQKHHREEGEEIAGSQVGLPGRKEIGIEGGDERELAHEQHEFGGAEAVLEYEHEAIGGDQHPGDRWRVAGRDSIPDRNHLRLFGPGDDICGCGARAQSPARWFPQIAHGRRAETMMAVKAATTIDLRAGPIN